MTIASVRSNSLYFRRRALDSQSLLIQEIILLFTWTL